jgi:hypothetical protein
MSCFADYTEGSHKIYTYEQLIARVEQQLTYNQLFAIVQMLYPEENLSTEATTHLSYDKLFELVESVSPYGVSAELLEQLCASLRSVWDRNYLIASVPILSHHIEALMYSCLFSGLDIPDTVLPLSLFHNLPCVTNTVRVGSVFRDPYFDELNETALRRIFRKVKNLILVNPMNLTAMVTIIPYPTEALKHIEIMLNGEGELRVVCHYAPKLLSIIATFEKTISLPTLHKIIPESLRKLHIRSLVHNPAGTEHKLQSVNQIALEGLSTSFDFTFFEKTSQQFKELTLQNTTQIPMNTLVRALTRSNLEMQILNLNNTNVLTDELLFHLTSVCKLLKVLQTDRSTKSTENPGFSVAGLREYLSLDCSRNLEILTVCGHTQITNEIFEVDFSCIQCLAILDLRNTSCTTHHGIDHLRRQKSVPERFWELNYILLDPKPIPYLFVYINTPEYFLKLQQSQEAQCSKRGAGIVVDEQPVQEQWSKAVVNEESAQEQWTQTAVDEDPAQVELTQAVVHKEPAQVQLTQAVVHREPSQEEFTQSVVDEEPAQEQWHHTVEHESAVKVLWNSTEDVSVNFLLSRRVNEMESLKSKISKLLRLHSHKETRYSVDPSVSVEQLTQSLGEASLNVVAPSEAQE